MGYVLLGIGVWSAAAGNLYNTAAWRMGMSGAMFQMIAHGISSAGMFFLVGVVYDRVHHRDLDRFGGLFQHMPIYSGISLVIFFAALGLPGLCGFIGEVLVVLSVWNFSMVLAVIAAGVVILTAGYILWTIQRVYLGPEYKGPHAEALRRMTPREIAIAAPLVVMAVVLGVFPNTLLKYTDSTISGLVNRLNVARQSAEFSRLPPAVLGRMGEGQGVRAARDSASTASFPSPQPSLNGSGGPDSHANAPVVSATLKEPTVSPLAMTPVAKASP
jgi:NADH-quinone oxidoreductase subunit M